MNKYKIVPVEPTSEMWAASGTAVTELTHIGVHHDIVSRVVFDAMLAASPDTGMVAVPRELLDRLMQAHEQSTVDWPAMRTLRTLLEGAQ